MPKLVHVAVGVVFNPAGQVLIALRDTIRHQGGLWEFPGGKIEEGESVQKALSRELMEEVNLQVIESSPLMTISHDYGDKQVLLDVWRVSLFSGLAQGREGQKIQWVDIECLENFSFPEANVQIITQLRVC